MRLELTDRRGIYLNSVNELNAADYLGQQLRVFYRSPCFAAFIDAFVINAWLLYRDNTEPV